MFKIHRSHKEWKVGVRRGERGGGKARFLALINVELLTRQGGGGAAFPHRPLLPFFTSTRTLATPVPCPLKANLKGCVQGKGGKRQHRCGVAGKGAVWNAHSGNPALTCSAVAACPGRCQAHRVRKNCK